MSEPAPEVPEELFREVKYYAVGDIDPQVIQLLKAGKAKEVSYNALASHIISEDGDNPEVGEAREVFDLPVVKPSWVTLSVQCGALLPCCQSEGPLLCPGNECHLKTEVPCGPWLRSTGAVAN